MRGRPRLFAFCLAAALGSLAATGCHSPGRRSIIGSRASQAGTPVLSPDGTRPEVETLEVPAAGVVAPARTVGALDRHPLLRKPKEYYDSTNSNKAVKTAAATVIGVPAGIVGELKQIVTGTPAAPAAAATY